jgi:hypothetical protein
MQSKVSLCPDLYGALCVKRVLFMTSARGDVRGELACGAVGRTTNLYSVDPDWDRDHDAVMRIGGSAPGRRVHS